MNTAPTLSTAKDSRPRSLLVVTSVDHRVVDGQVHALGPFVREVELFAELFDRVTVAAPHLGSSPPASDRPYRSTNVETIRLPLRGSESLLGKLSLLLRTPLGSLALARAMRRHDATHVRLPDSLGMLAAVLAPAFAPRSWAKYAGQWSDSDQDRPFLRMQRSVLRRWFRGPVTVYGEWPGEPQHIVPLFTTSLSRADLARAGEVADRRLRATRGKRPNEPLRVLFVGRLVTGKRVDVLIEACSQLRDVDWQLRVVGDGPEAARLRDLAHSASEGAESRVDFTGAVAHDRLSEHYSWADVLVLPSLHEGWGKVFNEAMAFAVPCISPAGGVVPQILEGRGIALADGSAASLRDALEKIGNDPALRSRYAAEARSWSSARSLEDLRDTLTEVLRTQWQVTVGPAKSLSASGES